MALTSSLSYLSCSLHSLRKFALSSSFSAKGFLFHWVSANRRIPFRTNSVSNLCSQHVSIFSEGVSVLAILWAREPPQFLKKSLRLIRRGKLQNLSGVQFPSIPGIAPRVASENCKLFVLLKLWAWPFREWNFVKWPENCLNFDLRELLREVPGVNSETLREAFPLRALFPEIGVCLPRLLRHAVAIFLRLDKFIFLAENYVTSSNKFAERKVHPNFLQIIVPGLLTAEVLLRTWRTTAHLLRRMSFRASNYCDREKLLRRHTLRNSTKNPRRVFRC